MPMKITGLTDKGKVRDENQDSFVYGFLDDSTVFAGVFDGMGGAKSGKYASTVAASGFEHKLKSTPIEVVKREPARVMADIIKEINYEMYEQSCTHEEFSGMGTTCVAALLINGRGYIANVGDSRAYLIDRKECLQITVDHSLVQGLVEMGTITAEQAKIHPHRNVITRALGTDSELEVDLFDTDVNNKKLLLCSDGLHGYFEPEQLQSVIMSVSDEDACEMLTAEAINLGGRDNITSVIINGL